MVMALILMICPAKWTRNGPHPFGIPCNLDGPNGTGRFQPDVRGREPVRLSNFDWGSLEAAQEALQGFPSEKQAVEAEMMETSGFSVRGHSLKVSMQLILWTLWTDLGSIPLIVDEGHEVISESSAELNALFASIRSDRLAALVVSATLTQEFVTYVGGKVIYVRDQPRCRRWRSANRTDESECWDMLVEEITYGCLRKLSQRGMMVFLPTLPKIEETAARLERLAATIERHSDHPDFQGGRSVFCVSSGSRACRSVACLCCFFLGIGTRTSAHTRTRRRRWSFNV